MPLVTLQTPPTQFNLKRHNRRMGLYPSHNTVLTSFNKETSHHIFSFITINIEIFPASFFLLLWDLLFLYIQFFSYYICSVYKIFFFLIVITECQVTVIWRLCVTFYVVHLVKKQLQLSLDLPFKNWVFYYRSDIEILRTYSSSLFFFSMAS